MQDSSAFSDEAVTEALSRTRPWMKFIAILGFIGCGFLLLDGLFVFLGMSLATPVRSYGVPHGIIILFALGWLASGIFLYLMPSILLMRAARALNGIERQCNLETIAAASEQQRRFWKYCGTVLIVAISVGLFFMLLAVLLPLGVRTLH